YHVREVVPPGWKETYPGPGFGWRVNLPAGVNPRNLNFGDTRIPTTVWSVQIPLKRGAGGRRRGRSAAHWTRDRGSGGWGTWQMVMRSHDVRTRYSTVGAVPSSRSAEPSSGKLLR